MSLVNTARTKRRGQRGFTLIELIVVLGILGLISMILAPKMLDTLNQSRKRAARASAVMLQSALDRYLVDNDTYPATAAAYADFITYLDNYLKMPAANGDGNWTWVSYALDGVTKQYTLVIQAKDTATQQYTVTPSTISPGL